MAALAADKASLEQHHATLLKVREEQRASLAELADMNPYLLEAVAVAERDGGVL